MAHPVVHFEISSKDGKKQSEFYQAIFGWKIDEKPEWNYRVVHKEGEGIGGGIFQSDEGRSYVTVYMQTEDVAGDLDKIVELGGMKLMGPDMIPGVGTIGVFADPEGIVMGLYRPEAR